MAVLLLALAGAPAALADRIVLKNGHVIEADRAWVQGQQVLYEKNGGSFGIPRSIVASLDLRAEREETSDPEVRRARALLEGGNPAEAVRALKGVLAQRPQDLAALQDLSEAQARLGNGHAAREAARQALAVEPRNARSLALLGDALVLLADLDGAVAAYERSLRLHPDADVEARLAAARRTLEPARLAPLPASPEVPLAISPGGPGPLPASGTPRPLPSGAGVRLRFDGGVNEPLGAAVLEAAGGVHAEYCRRFGFTPQPITIVLQTEADFSQGGTPPWAAALYDGSVRIPARGISQVTPALLGVLRHELAHAFVAERTGGNCPTWLQEGVAQWLEGVDLAAVDARLAQIAARQPLLPLLSLEGPFQGLAERDVNLAYAESVSAVGFILRQRGEPALVRLLSALGDGLPSEEALPVALALSYPELQQVWQATLKLSAEKR